MKRCAWRADDHEEMANLIERAWKCARRQLRRLDRLCSLVTAKSGGCAEDCGFWPSPLRRGRHADARDDGGPTRSSRTRGGGGCRGAPLLHGHPRTGPLQARLRRKSSRAQAGREHTNLKRCASIGPHVRRSRQEAARGGDPARHQRRSLALPGVSHGPRVGCGRSRHRNLWTGRRTSTDRTR